MMSKLEKLWIETMHHNTGLVAREDVEESKEVNGVAMQNAESQTDEHRVLG